MAGDLNFKVNFDTQQAGSEILALLNKFVSGSEAAGDKLNRALGGTTERKLIIRTERDDSGVKQLKSELVTIRSEADKLKNALSQATKVQPGSLTNVRQELNKQKQLRDSIAEFGKQIDLTSRKDVISAKQTQQWLAANARVKELETSLKNLSDADKGFGGRVADKFAGFLAIGNKIQDIVTIFQSLSIAVGAITAPVKAATNALADLDAFALSFQAIGQSSDAAQGALSEASRIALGLGVSVKTVREGFQQLSPVVLNSGGSMQDVSKITESLSSRFAAFGLSADKSRRVLNGVIQAFAKGKLQAEELTQQISEADPAFKTDFASALLKAKDSLGDLGSEVDGTVSNLEGLIKEGKITSDVLIAVIPGLSKASVLFGKLGGSATSAAQSLDPTGSKLNQVRAQFESLNQLNLERFANIGRPLVKTFLIIEATVIDFITTVSKLQVTKDIAAIFNEISNAVANAVKFILAGAEAILRIVGVFTPFVNALTKIPGLLELVGLGLLASIVKPVKQAIQTVNGLRLALDQLAQTSLKKAGGGGSGVLIDAKSNEVAIASAKKLRDQFEKPVKNAVNKSILDIKNSSGLAEGAIDGLTKKQKKQLASLETDLNSLTGQYSGLSTKLRELQQQSGSIKPVVLTDAQKNKAAIQSQIQDLRRLQAEAKANAAAIAKGSGIGEQGLYFTADPALEGQKKQLREQYILANSYKVKINELEQALSKLGNVSVAPDVNVSDNLTAEIDKVKSELSGLENDIKKKYKGIYDILGTPIQSRIEIPTAKIDELIQLTDKYRNTSVNAYADVISSQNKEITNLEAGTAALEKRQTALKGLLDKARVSGPSTDTSQIRGDFESVSAAIEQNQKKITTAKAANVELARSYLDLGGALSNLESGTKSGIQQGVTKLGKAFDIVKGSLGEAEGAVKSLTASEAALADKQKVLQAALQQAPSGPVYDDLTRQLDDTNGKLGEVRGQLELNKQAAADFGKQASLISGAIDEGVKSSSGFRGIEANLKDLAANGNAVTRQFGRLGLGIAGFGKGAINAIKGIGASIAAIGPEIAIFAALSVAMAAYNRATQTAKNTQEEAKAGIDGLKSSVADLKKGLEEATGAPQAGNIDALIPKLSGLDVILVTLGNSLKTAKDKISEFFNYLAGVTTDPVTKQVKEATGQVNVFAAVLAGAGAGALAGFALGFGPIGTVIGTVVGGLLSYIAATQSASAAVSDIQERGKALRESYAQQYEQLGLLVGQLNAYSTAIGGIKQEVASGKITNEEGLAKEAALLGRATAGYKALLSTFDTLKQKRQQNLQDFGALKQKTQELRAEIEKLKGVDDVTGFEYNFGTGGQTKDQIDAQKQKLAELRGELKKNEAAQNEAVQNARLLAEAEKQLQAELDKLKGKFPGLTEEMVLNGQTISNLSDKYKQGKSDLENLDPGQLPDQFDALAYSLGETKQELEAIEQRAAGQELAGYINAMQTALANGDIPNSLQNINNLVSALENRAVLLDINSPDLPKVITELEQAKGKVEELDGKRAAITVEVITKGLKDGSLQPTPETLGRLRGAYDKQAQTSAVGSPEYEQALNNSKKLAEVEKFNAMSLGELKNQIIQREQEIRTQQIAANHDAAMQKLREENDARMKGLDDATKAVNKYYDAQISSLQELGPAEQQLANQRIAALQKQAGQGGQTGLEARAQLERIDREKKIAALQEEKAKEIEKLEQKKVAQQEEFQAKEKALLEQRKADEKEIADQRMAGLNEELKKLQDALKERKDGAEKTAASYLSELDKVSTRMDEIFNKEYTAKVNIVYSGSGKPPGLWTGGPTIGGMTYKVNELGQEGFMNKFGGISPINKARNSLWKAPGDGFVIPADIYSTLRAKNTEAPKTKLSHTSPKINPNHSRKDPTLGMANIIGGYLSAQSARLVRSEENSAKIQNHQAMQIAKLSNEIAKLADKNWNVDVKVRNTGNAAYLDALNRLL